LRYWQKKLDYRVTAYHAYSIAPDVCDELSSAYTKISGALFFDANE